MTLTVLQIDAVTELANIGISRATQQLAGLLNEEVHMEVPRVEWVSSEDINQKIQLPVGEEVSCIYQNIRGRINGSAALLLHPEDSQALLQGLISVEPNEVNLDLQQYQYEALMEIANIIISSCISAMADTLCLELSISLPHYCQAKLEYLMGNHLSDDDNQRQNAVLINAKMQSQKNHKGGQIQILLSEQVVNQILNSILDEN